MQIITRGAIDASMAEPLLSRGAVPSGGIAAGAAAPATRAGGGSGEQPEEAAPAAASAARDHDLHFRRHFVTLVRLLRPYAALVLSLMAVGQAVVVAEVGKVAGSFYRILVDRHPAELAGALLRAAVLYAVSAVLYAASCWITGMLALHWRQRLTLHLHRRYCQGHAFYTLQLQQQQQQTGQQVTGQQGQQGLEQEGPLAAGGSSPASKARQAQQAQQADSGSTRDNPDQRIAADAAQLCDCLAAVAKVAAAAPFKLLYYSWLTWGYLGWRGLIPVYAFFWGAAFVQRLAVAPVSRLVFGQERREGDLRFAHLRLREYGAEVAQYGGAPAERRHLDATLAAALANLRLLVTWRTLLAASTRAVDYAGALLNYVVVGAAVFAGMDKGGNDGGTTAQFISNASFATLSLIYTVTELLDLSEQISRLGGLAARVGELLDALPPDHPPLDTRPAESGSGGGEGSGHGGEGSRHDRHALHAVRLSMDGQELQPSLLATLLQPPRLLSCLGGSVELEASVHLLGADLQHEARAIFPEAPLTGQLLACITFQFAAGGLSLAPDSSAATLQRAAAEMDSMLDAFLRWEEAIRAYLTESGCWVDAVDPRTGTALHGRRGTRWSEVAAAHALLGYERRDAGICPVVLHPLHGSSAYPATLFTDASPVLLSQALAAAADGGMPQALGATHSSIPPGLGGGDSELLLRLCGVSLRTLAGSLAVADLDLGIRPGQHLLIAGPNGCGKSTLMKALCGLHPFVGGTMHAVSGSGTGPGGSAQGSNGSNSGSRICGSSRGGVMFVPQRPLAAPGGALWQQICYPGSSENSSNGSGVVGEQQEQEEQQQEQDGGEGAERPSDSGLLVLLQRVDLQYLLDRVGGSFTEVADWGAMLSPGELQRLAVARVLHRRPSLVVLDEVTSAVSEEAAGKLYCEMHADGITCISIGQDCDHLRRLHPLLLRLGMGPQEGSWQLVGTGS